MSGYVWALAVSGDGTVYAGGSFTKDCELAELNYKGLAVARRACGVAERARRRGAPVTYL